jgi:hypothetical protein
MSETAADDPLLALASDPLVNALITTTRELWVTRERLFLLEHELAERNLLPRTALDSVQPQGALAAHLAAERKALVDGLLAALSAGLPRGPVSGNS